MLAPNEAIVKGRATKEMPRYLIHVGPHKTGSTYLQGRFHSTRAMLLGRGVMYPELWQGKDKYSHPELPRKLRAGADHELMDEFEFLNSSDNDTVLISAEDLVGLSAANILTLRSLLGRASARVIFYCRRWSELLPSGWQELVKHGHTNTLPEFFSAHVVNAPGSNIINYGQALDRYAEHFGLKNISLVYIAISLMTMGDLFVHFCHNFLSGPIPPPALDRVNVAEETGRSGDYPGSKRDPAERRRSKERHHFSKLSVEQRQPRFVRCYLCNAEPHRLCQYERRARLATIPA